MRRWKRREIGPDEDDVLGASFEGLYDRMMQARAEIVTILWLQLGARPRVYGRQLRNQGGHFGAGRIWRVRNRDRHIERTRNSERVEKERFAQASRLISRQVRGESRFTE